jgi:regulator of telomere elongation helicase 1
LLSYKDISKAILIILIALPSSLESPVKFYDLQKLYIDDIKQAVKIKGQVLIIEAGTGFGKTIANLYGVLTANLDNYQIIYLSKTHKQNNQVITELARINEVNSRFLTTGLQMASRRQLCHIDHVANASVSTAADLCQKYQGMKNKTKEFNQCISIKQEGAKKKQKIKLPVVLTIEKLEKIANQYQSCAYLTARDLLVEFDVITGHFNYYLSSDIRKAVGIEDPRAVLILDEGHNLEELLCSEYSRTIYNTTLINACNEVKLVDYKLYNQLNRISETIKLLIKMYGKENQPQLLTGPSVLNDIFPSYNLGKETVSKLYYRFVENRDLILDHQFHLTGTYPSILAIDKVLDFFQLKGFNSIDFGYIIHKSKKGYKFQRICLNPSLAFKNIRRQSRSIIICSGTLSPLSLYQEILGLKDETTNIKKYDSITDPRRVRVVVFKNNPNGDLLTTKYDYRTANPEVYKHFLTSLEELIEIAISGGILIFVPSYAFLHRLRIPNYIVTSNEQVKCFQEVQDSKENKYILEDYVSNVQQGNKTVLAGVFGGKLAEGTDFPQELSRMVIIIGIPFPPPNEPYIKLKRDYYNQKRHGLGFEWYQAQAYRRVAQALGRGWRSDKDYSIGILLDQRFTGYSVSNQLPLWIKNRIYRARDWTDGKRVIQDFLTRIKGL